MIMFAVILVLAVVGLYWWRFGIWSGRPYSRSFLAVLLTMCAVLVLANRTDKTLTGEAVPSRIGIVSDVSLSMDTGPDPRAHKNVGTRLSRARRVLLQLLAELDASATPVMIGVKAFTSKSETILSWDDNLSQVHEVVEHVLTTGLLTEPGSNLGAALSGAVELFENIPEEMSEQKKNRFLIVVSDGEQTGTQTAVASALTKLRQAGVKIISVYVGMQDAAEGLVVRDEAGNVMGFDDVGGQTYSVPDPEIMRLVAGTEPSTGIFVDAGDSNAAQRIMNFTGVSASIKKKPLYLALVLTLWVLSMVIMMRFP